MILDSNNYESLKREATNLENQIDQKIISYSKFYYNIKEMNNNLEKFNIDEEEGIHNNLSLNSMVIEIEELFREVSTKIKKNIYKNFLLSPLHFINF